MSITLSYPVLSDPVTKTEIEQNFADLGAKFGNIVSSDLGSNSSITATQLAAPYQELWVILENKAAGWAGGNAVVDFIPIPGSATDDNWYLTDITWACSDIGDGAGTFGISLGNYNGAANVWREEQAFVANVAISSAGTANAGNQVRAYENANSYEFIMSGNTGGLNLGDPLCLALISNNAGVGVATAAFSFRVACCLKRYITTF